MGPYLALLLELLEFAAISVAAVWVWLTILVVAVTVISAHKEPQLSFLPQHNRSHLFMWLLLNITAIGDTATI